jgi:phosphate transport system substrate-binding protein
MPPEVLASLAEQTYTCVEGDTQVHAIETVAAVAGDWQMSLEGNCPGMTITPTTELTEAAELQIFRADSSATGTSYSEVPFALDAVVLAVSLTDITNVNLSAAALGKIWSGEITSWNDSELAALNPNFELPDVPISFGVDSEVGDTKSFLDWMQRLAGKEITLEGGSATLEDFAEGSIVLTKYSKATELFVTMAGIVTEEGGEGVIPTMETVLTAATMFKTKTENGKIALTFEPKAKAIAPEGIAIAPMPYQAVALITLALVGEDSLKTRAAARYLLRQDSQGSLGLSSVIALPEMLRAISLTTVSIGLPQPTLAPQ